MPNPCVFCGSTDCKITKEHVVPEWIGKLFPRQDRPTTHGIHQQDGKFLTFQAPPLQLTVRVACERCNGGWMHKLEERVISKLGPMIQSARVTRLTPTTQASIATWAVKTALMLQYLHPAPRAIPGSEYHRFYDEQQPPEGYAVFLGRSAPHVDTRGEVPMVSGTYVPQRLNVVEGKIVDQQGRAASEDGYPFVVIFAVGHTVFIVAGTNAPFRTVMRGLQTDALHQIWPVSPRVTWPPQRIIGDMSAFGKVFGDPPKEAP